MLRDSSRDTTKLTMCADGVLSVSSIDCVMMPARDGGVCGKPPLGAAGMVGGIVEMLTKRTAGFVSYGAPNGLLMLVDIPNAKPWSKFDASPWPMRSKTFA